MSGQYFIGPCNRCSLGVPIGGKPDVDYVIVPGFGIAKDFVWHMPCAIEENEDPQSPWKGTLILKGKL